MNNQINSTTSNISQHQESTPNYTLEEQLGQGAYGTVFKGKCKTTGETVALKYINLEGKPTDYYLAICREVKIMIFLTSLKSNIYTLKLKDIIYQNGSNPSDPESIKGIYLVTEYVPFSLEQILTQFEDTLNDQ